MTTVKFDKSVKYQGVRHAAHEAFKVDNGDVEQLKVAGAIVLSVDEPEESGEESVDESYEESVEESEPASDKDVAQLKEELLNYTVPELVAFANDNAIDLMGKTRKADIYNIIVDSLK